MSSTLNIRFANPSDAGALERLAALDSAKLPAGELLMAEVGGDVVAAVSLRGGHVADPFRHTAELLELLELRAKQLRAEDGRTFDRTGVRGRAQALPALP